MRRVTNGGRGKKDEEEEGRKEKKRWGKKRKEHQKEKGEKKNKGSYLRILSGFEAKTLGGQNEYTGFQHRLEEQ